MYGDESCLRLVGGKIQCMLFKFAQEVGVSNVDDDSLIVILGCKDQLMYQNQDGSVSNVWSSMYVDTLHPMFFKCSRVEVEMESLVPLFTLDSIQGSPVRQKNVAI